MRVIFIEKLFGEHNIQIDLDKKLNIMIGENGIGKTTILNIIQLLYQVDFVNLTKYNFKRIRMTTEASNIEIEMKDLFPEIREMIDEIAATGSSFVKDLIKFEKGLTKVYEAKTDIYNEFMSACFHEKPLSNRVKHTIKSICENEEEMYYLKNQIRSFMSSKINTTKSSFQKESSYLLFSKMGENIKNEYSLKKDIYEFFTSPIVSLNMVNKYALKEKPVNRAMIYSNVLSWLNKYSEINAGSRLNEVEGSPFERFLKSEVIKSDFLIGLPRNTPPKYSNEYINMLKKAYKDPEFRISDAYKDTKKIIEEIINDSVVDVNGIINKFFYTEDFIKGINNKAITYYYETIGEPYSFDDYTLASDYFNEEDISKIEDYVEPLIMHESIFGSIIARIISPVRQDSSDLEILVTRFKKFYDENINDIINSINPKVKVFEELLNEFITSKTFIVTPSELKIFKNKYKEFEDGKFKVIENNVNEISMNDLSSGEKKLVIILLFSCIFDNVLLLMDEPELSFSINWQEKIMETIYNQENSNSYLIATHSPFIITNGEIAKSILPLPMEE